MSERATPAARGLTKAECDNCGNDIFYAWLTETRVVLECEACGHEENL